MSGSSLFENRFENHHNGRFIDNWFVTSNVWRDAECPSSTILFSAFLKSVTKRFIFGLRSTCILEPGETGYFPIENDLNFNRVAFQKFHLSVNEIITWDTCHCLVSVFWQATFLVCRRVALGKSKMSLSGEIVPWVANRSSNLNRRATDVNTQDREILYITYFQAACRDRWSKLNNL